MYYSVKTHLKKKIALNRATKSYISLHNYIFSLTTKGSVRYDKYHTQISFLDLKKLKLSLKEFISEDESILEALDQAIYYSKLVYRKFLVKMNYLELNCKTSFFEEDIAYINKVIQSKIDVLKEKIQYQQKAKNKIQLHPQNLFQNRSPQSSKAMIVSSLSFLAAIFLFLSHLNLFSFSKYVLLISYIMTVSIVVLQSLKVTSIQSKFISKCRLLLAQN